MRAVPARMRCLVTQRVHHVRPVIMLALASSGRLPSSLHEWCESAWLQVPWVSSSRGQAQALASNAPLASTARLVHRFAPGVVLVDI